MRSIKRSFSPYIPEDRMSGGWGGTNLVRERRCQIRINGQNTYTHMNMRAKSVHWECLEVAREPLSTLAYI